jgi:hypothetical protein
LPVLLLPVGESRNTSEMRQSADPRSPLNSFANILATRQIPARHPAPFIVHAPSVEFVFEYTGPAFGNVVRKLPITNAVSENQDVQSLRSFCASDSEQVF